MPNKIVQYVVAGSLLLIAGVPIGYLAHSGIATPVVSDEVVVEIKPTECAVGELIQLKAEGKNAAWTVEPASPDAISFGNENEHFVASFRSAARYVVIQASIINGKVVIAKTVFDVTGGGAATGWVAKIRGWNPGPESKALAGSFRTVSSFVAEKIAAGTLVAPDEILQKTTESNQRVLGSNAGKWTTFFANLQGELDSLQTNGDLTTQRDFVRVWNEIASALESL